MFMGLLILGVNIAFCFVRTLAMVGKGLTLVHIKFLPCLRIAGLSGPTLYVYM